MIDFLGLIWSAPRIVDWTPDRTYETASGHVRQVTSDSHRFDLEFTGVDASGTYGMEPKLNSHYNANKGKVWTMPMPQSLYAGRLGANDYGYYEPSPANARLVLSRKAAAGDTELVVVASAGFALPQGWYLSVAGHPKVYRLLTETRWRGAHARQTLRVYPSLRAAAPVNTVVNWSPDYRCVYRPGAAPNPPYDGAGVTTARVQLLEAV